jgi:AcrR family transcriptional regulator
VTSATDRYHHGDLPNALRRAAVDVIDERGLGGFSLREVARRAGVSHTAPAHHFGDVRGLLTSVAAEGFDALERVTSAAAARHDDPVEQLRAVGEAYVALARSNAGHCAVMFRTDLVDTDDAHLQLCGMGAYAVIEGVVARLLESLRSTVELDHATWMCWSTMQGLVQLEPKFQAIDAARGREPVSTQDLIDRFSDLLVNAFRPAARADSIVDDIHDAR